MLSFDGKRILVTGGSRGIGRATVAAFLERGAHVALNGSSESSTQAAIDTLAPREGQQLIAVPGDVGSVEGCRAIVAAAVEGLGGLDVLVNSAGVGWLGHLAEFEEESWDRMLDINLKGTFFCCQAALPHLQASGGNIVNLGSDAGLMGDAGLSAYCASKGGVVNMTRSLALELAPNVRVNVVCPGFVDSDMTRRDGIEQADDPAAYERAMMDFAPLKRMGMPHEIAMAIIYLAGEDAGFVTGAALQIDGGSTAGHPQ